MTTSARDIRHLPIAALLESLREAWRSSPCVVLQAPPGAGKSTALPLWLLQQIDPGQGRLVLLQPRRMAAEQIAAYLAGCLGEALGEQVGLTTRERRVVSPRTRLEVVTDGIFLRQIQTDPSLQGVAGVLFDEFHERSWQSDLALALALESQQLRDQPLRLLVMSATLQADALASLLDAPVLRSEGRSYPVAIDYRPAGRLPWAAHLAQCARDSLAGGARRVLVFLPGLRWMRQAAAALAPGLAEGTPVHLLHAGLSAAQQQAILQPGAGPDVILATNVAETSVTIEGVDVVIDSGWVRRAVFEPRRGLDRLLDGMVARDAAEQRAGRAGRLGPGRCIRLWSREQQGHLAATEEPQVRQVDLAPLALELAAWGVSDPAQLTLLDAPDPARWAGACELLQRLGALDERGQVTAAGREMAALGVHPRLGRMLLAGRETEQLGPATWLAALLGEGDCWPRERGEPPADLALRGPLLRQAPGRLRQQRERLLRRLGKQRSGAERPGSAAAPVSPELAHAGLLLAAGFADRVAQARDLNSGRYLSAAGFELQLPRGDHSLAGAPWLVVADCDGDGRIRLALRLDDAEVTDLVRRHAVRRLDCTWDAGSGRVQARESLSLGAITLEERTVPVPPGAARPLLVQALREQGFAALQPAAATLAWLERVRWLGARRPQWPDFSEAALMAQLDDWLLPWLPDDARDLNALRRLDLLSLLQARLGHDGQRELQRLAPLSWLLPGGLSRRIDYSGEGGPRLSLRLQDCFGLDLHPCLPEDGGPLLLELLSPAQRPLQLTRDLPGFWRGSYTEVRKEMRGRYPRHHWPEQPWLAPAPTPSSNRAGGRGRPR